MERLILKNTFNTRDLGGYNNIKYHCFLRSDDISKMDTSEISFLKKYGITTIIDLRSSKEVENSLLAHDFKYFHISLIKNMGDITKANGDFILSDLYIHILKDSKDLICEVFKIFANYDGVLFHCTAGKDRTGIIAMLLLGFLGTPKQDIITDYEITYTLIKNNKKFIEQNIKKEYLYSLPIYIETAIDYVINEYKNFENYLLSIGVLENELKSIKNKCY